MSGIIVLLRPSSRPFNNHNQIRDHLNNLGTGGGVVLYALENLPALLKHVMACELGRKRSKKHLLLQRGAGWKSSPCCILQEFGLVGLLDQIENALLHCGPQEVPPRPYREQPACQPAYQKKRYRRGTQRYGV